MSLMRIPALGPAYKSIKLLYNTLGSAKRLHSQPKIAAAFCEECGNKMEEKIPQGDSRLRLVCGKCNHIAYKNPRLVVGCIVEHESKILMCRRSIEPSRGLWTWPSGYMEIGESLEEGARRETLEEARTNVSIESLYSVIELPFLGQIHVTFRACLASPFEFSPGSETMETKLVTPEEIKTEEVAFTSMMVVLNAYVEDRKLGKYRMHRGVLVRERKGAKPNELGAHSLIDYVAK